jgi:protein arginine kinase
MNIHEFLPSPTEVSRRRGPEDRIVLSSRVRLARNIQGHLFPGWGKKADRLKSYEVIRPAVEELQALQGAFSDSMEKLSPLDKQVLVERHLISREHAARGAGSGLVLRQDETICVMINEEDHLRMQALLPGFQIRQAWELIDAVDSTLEERLDYAFSNRLGYLTACPTNVGTAIRVSAMLHLPGLVLADQIQHTIKAVSDLGMAVRGFYGEGTDALGNVFQVSNQRTLGEKEENIVERLSKVLLQLLENEQNARATLTEKKPKILLNQVGRAYGTLANAHIISSKETMNQLSLLRLGVEMGCFPEADVAAVNELFIITQPSHLQRNSEHKLSADERDVLRADLLRDRLARFGRPAPPA